MPKATLVCSQCGHTARRELVNVTACRGHRETPTERATCPRCLIEMDRPEQHLRFSAYNVDAPKPTPRCRLCCDAAASTHYCTSVRRVIGVDNSQQSR